MQNKPLIGLLGGTSWPSTISYYEELNRQINYPRILLYSIDYGRIKPLYGNSENWQKIAELLKAEIEIITSKGIDSLIICNNTLHKAFDMIEPSLNLQIPVHHAGKLSAKKAQKLGAKKVLLMATKFTMQDGFFAKYFIDLGIEVVLPNLQEMDERRIPIRPYIDQSIIEQIYKAVGVSAKSSRQNDMSRDSKSKLSSNRKSDSPERIVLPDADDEIVDDIDEEIEEEYENFQQKKTSGSSRPKSAANRKK